MHQHPYSPTPPHPQANCKTKTARSDPRSSGKPLRRSSMEAKIEELLGQLTIEEKVAMLAGASTWLTVPVERLGIPAIKVSDGPNGARGDVMSGGSVTSACFPVGIGLAASWDPALVEQIGRALGEETKSKGAHVLLAPTVNIHRSPLN